MPAGQWMAPASRSRAKARGTPVSMVARNGGSGARHILGSMSKCWRFGPSLARQAICNANLPRGEIAGSHIGDAPVLPDLLNQISADETIGSVTDPSRDHASHDPAGQRMKREGFAVARCTVERLMKQIGIRGAVRGKVVKTTVPDTSAPCPRDKVNRVFRAPAPNMLWPSHRYCVSTAGQ